MTKSHHYKTKVEWTGNTGKGTESYTSYQRNYTLSVDGKPPIHGSSDPAFLGDKTKYNPEDLLLASMSICHMLWYLHLCADEKIVVTNYWDEATATMIQTAGGGGKFTEATLHITVTITDPSKAELAKSLHEKANQCCFIANSLNFKVHHQPSILIQSV